MFPEKWTFLKEKQFPWLFPSVVWAMFAVAWI